jgi:hypothetical protein
MGVMAATSGKAANSCQAPSTSRQLAISAMEQPAVKSGRMTICSAAVRMSADSAMKCTPQKTI